VQDGRRSSVRLWGNKLTPKPKGGEDWRGGSAQRTQKFGKEERKFSSDIKKTILQHLQVRQKWAVRKSLLLPWEEDKVKSS